MAPPRGTTTARTLAPQAPADFDATSCAACDGGPLDMHMRVAGGAGARGLAPTTDQFGTALGDIVRCRACGHMQLDRFPDESDLAAAYVEVEGDDYVDEEEGQRATAARVLERVERHASRGRLVDLGCWMGFLVAEARERGWDALGVEPNPRAAALARERLMVDVLTARIEDAKLAPASYDAVVLGDVIEHLPRPGEALDRIARLLAPGGVVCLMLPDAGSRLARAMGRRWWSVIPTHVQYFTRASLITLLGRHGFDVLAIETAPKAFTVRYYLDRIGGYSPRLARALVAAAQRTGVADRIWAPDFRDRMLVVASCRAPTT